MTHVPGGMIIVALPRVEAAEVRAAWSAAESSVTPSHFIPVAKTGLMMQGLLMFEQPSAAGATDLEEIRAVDCADVLPAKPKPTKATKGRNLFTLMPPQWSGTACGDNPPWPGKLKEKQKL